MTQTLFLRTILLTLAGAVLSLQAYAAALPSTLTLLPEIVTGSEITVSDFPIVDENERAAVFVWMTVR